MGSFCGSSSRQGPTTTQNTTSSTSIDPNVQRFAGDVMDSSKALAGMNFTPYSGERVAPLTEQQRMAMGGAQALYEGADPRIRSTALGLANRYGTAPAAQLDDRRTDVGDIQSFMDPYLEAVLGPALREIGRSGQMARNQIGAAATFGNAFGDARHGVAEGVQRGREQEAVGDVTARLHSDAFRDASGRRFQEIDYLSGLDALNADLYEQALGRALQGGDALLGFERAADQNEIARLATLMEAGALGQQQGQNRLDFDFQEFLRQQEHPYRGFDVLTSALSGQPVAQSTTTSGTTSTRTPGSSSGSMQAIASIIGALL